MTLYFVQGSGKHERAHVAKATTRREVVLMRHYGTACGALIRPNLWSLRAKLDKGTALCEACAKAKGLSIMDAGDTP